MENGIEQEAGEKVLNGDGAQIERVKKNRGSGNRQWWWRWGKLHGRLLTLDGSRKIFCLTLRMM